MYPDKTLLQTNKIHEILKNNSVTVDTIELYRDAEDVTCFRLKFTKLDQVPYINASRRRIVKTSVGKPHRYQIY